MTLKEKIATKGARNNCLNELQVLAAILVIYSHAFPLGQGYGGDILYDVMNGRWKFGSLCVACFFILSGFLCSQSYLRQDRFIGYLKNRALRIFPGLIVVFVLCTFVMGPIITTLSFREYFSSPVTWTYLKSIWPFPLNWSLPGVFEGNVFGTSVNGSLWTIPYQLVLYLGLGIMGLAGILKKRNLVLGIFIATIVAYVCRDTLFAGVTHFMSMPLYDWLY